MLPSVPAILVSGLCKRQSSSTSIANAAAQTLRHLRPIFILRCGSLKSHDLLVTMSRVVFRLSDSEGKPRTAASNRRGCRREAAQPEPSYNTCHKHAQSHAAFVPRSSDSRCHAFRLQRAQTAFLASYNYHLHRTDLHPMVATGSWSGIPVLSPERNDARPYGYIGCRCSDSGCS